MFLVSSSCYVCILVFFFKQKTAYELRISDWSSDVCSSDLDARAGDGEIAGDVLEARHAAQLGLDDAGPFVQLVEVDVLQGVLVRRLRQPRPDPDRRRVLHEGAYPGHDRELLAQLLNDLFDIHEIGRAPV